MCIEDIRLGRKTKSVEYQQTVPVAGTQLFGPDSDRVFIFFGPSVTGPYSVSTNPNATNLNGILISQTGGGLFMDIRNHGDLVCRAWYGAATAPVLVSSIEGTLVDK